MSALNNSLLLGQEGGGGYAISRSLRFNSSDSAYLSRTPASAGNRKTWTFSCWLKKCKNSSSEDIFSVSTGTEALRFDSDSVYYFADSGQIALMTTNAVLRDPSAWYHIILSVDTTQATASNRANIYINGVLQTLYLSNRPSLNYNTLLNNANALRIGGSNYLNGLLADIHFCDGTAYDASAFGEFDANGIWQPKKFAGVYGSQGWKLDFSDNSAATATTLGKDSSGNGNNWTPNNLSVTAGAGNDSLVDVPTNGSEVDTGLGGQVRGNYCTWNPLSNFNSSTLSNGNLDVVTAGSAGGGAVFGTIAIPSSGKWYWETTVTSTTLPSIDIAFAGIVRPVSGTYQTNVSSFFAAIYFLGGGIGGTVYSSTGTKTNGSSINVGDVCGIAVDRDNGAIYFYKNGVANGSVTGFTFTEGMFPYVEDNSGGSGQSSITANFGQRPFAYTAPSGFKALCTANLPAPVVTKPSDVMDVKLYTGNGSTQTISGLGFSPDFVWIKNRSTNLNGHTLFDSVRGAARALYSYLTQGEDNFTGVNKSLTAFNSDGFTVIDVTAGDYGTNGSVGGVYSSSAQFAAFCWDAGSSTVTNTAGSISSQVRANASAGFSVVTFTGTGSTGTIGHGLGVAPSVYLVKKRSGTSDWAWFTTSIDGSVDFLFLNSTAAKTDAGGGYATAPTSSVFSLGDASSSINDNGGTYVAYCFAPLAGYSSFGSYTGNGSSQFVYLGFRPKFWMHKRTDSTGSWMMVDAVRSSYNVAQDQLYANLSNADSQYGGSGILDFVSNGVVLRSTGSDVNGSNVPYVYIAFAESPFQFARAR